MLLKSFDLSHKVRIKWLNERDDQKRRNTVTHTEMVRLSTNLRQSLYKAIFYSEIHHNLPFQLLLPSTFSKSSLACYCEGGAAQSTLSGNDYSLPWRKTPL